MMHIFKWMDPISLQEHQFDVEASSGSSTNAEHLRGILFAKLDQLSITGNFPVKVITNYGTKVWMVHHTVSRRFTWKNQSFAGNQAGWLMLQESCPMPCYLLDENGDSNIDISACSAELAIKLLNDGHTLYMDAAIGFREINSYSVAYEI